ncbi:unnamed protein product [Sphagnum balticum]
MGKCEKISFYCPNSPPCTSTADTCSVQRFVDEHLYSNVPCVFCACTTATWRARALWRNGDDDSMNTSYLCDVYGECAVLVVDVCAGDCEVPVAHVDADAHYTSTDRQRMRLRDFFGRSTSLHTAPMYVKDWHIDRVSVVFLAPN